MLEGVPWAIDGGVHSAEVGRVLAYMATGQAEGVAAVSDFKVRASSIPDGNVHIQPGAVACLNRFPGGNAQSYIVRNIADEVKAMTPQGSGGVRYDLVCIIVEDPEYPGQPDPVDVLTGPYVRIAVYENVASTVSAISEVDADQTGYALARVKFDASDGTVTAADITDLRQLIRPHNDLIPKQTAFGVVGLDPLALNDILPISTSKVSIYIPVWCNRIAFQIEVGPFYMGDLDTAGVTPNASGQVVATFGALTSDPVDISTASADGMVQLPSSFLGIILGSIVAVDSAKINWEVDIPVGMRGTTVDLKTKLSARTVGAGQDIAATTSTSMVVTGTVMESTKSAL